MITVHHLENSRSQRVLWLLEELGVDYEIKRYERNKKTSLAPPELKKVHPLGKSPVITDGDRTIAESGAITEYLIDNYGKDQFKPKPGTEAALRNTYWMHYAEGTLMPLMVMTLIFNRVEQAPWIVRPIAKAISGQVKKAYLGPNTKANLAFVESELAEHTWFSGEDITGADFQMIFPLEAAAARGGMANQYPNIKAYVDRVHARPAYKRGLERGGPYELMGN
ncbi:MAG: glutathione S-transferase [Salinisphaeraceae bacterium]|nr:glutathione S-transferase [Salinisphaeraceae bacterium]